MLFAAIIFGSLWLLQTVFLQNFYDAMVIHNVKKAAGQLAEQKDSPYFTDSMDELASSQSLLIFWTDEEGQILYSADEHHAVYTPNQAWHDSGENPYRQQEEPLNWQAAALRHLPQAYDDFLRRLSASETGTMGYTTEDGTVYVYGMRLHTQSASLAQDSVLYISTPLGAVGAAVGILRRQLVWVTIASLVLGLAIAYGLAKQFARPVAALTAQAKSLLDSEVEDNYAQGFCTELDELSQTLGQTAKALEELENARRELLANISHDLRTPLTMIKGYAEMVQEISWADDTKRADDLAVIIREADRLTGLVNDIVEYSAWHSGKQLSIREAVNLTAAAQTVMEQFVPLEKAKGIFIEAVLEPEQWVLGDSEQLKRVLYNLLDNAIGHAGSSHKVRVCIQGVGDTLVRAEVQDFGEGIAEEELPYIWERYFTAKNRPSGGKSSGLGLAIVKEILLGLDAAFGVDSTVGEGSIFWFEVEKYRP